MNEMNDVTEKNEMNERMKSMKEGRKEGAFSPANSHAAGVFRFPSWA